MDIYDAINLKLKKNIKPNTYILKNSKNYSIIDIIKRINIIFYKKIKIKWQSTKTFKEKIYRHKLIKNWTPKNSNIEDIVDLIKK